VENQKSLQPGTLIGELANAVEDEVNNLFANGVMAASIIIGRVFFASYQLLGMEKLSVDTGSDLVCKRLIKYK
jgi:hypothetical protein